MSPLKVVFGSFIIKQYMNFIVNIEGLFIVFCGLLLAHSLAVGLLSEEGSPALVLEREKIGFESTASYSCAKAIADLREQGLDKTMGLEVPLRVNDMRIDVSCKLEEGTGWIRLDTLEDLRKVVRKLPSSEVKATLAATLDKIETILETIQDVQAVTIEVLEDHVERVVAELEEGVIARVEENFDRLPRDELGALLLSAKNVKKHYDALEYMMGKIRLHARLEVQSRLAALLHEATVSLIEGSEDRYIQCLTTLLSTVAEYCGTMIKAKEADRVCSKADSLLRQSVDAGQREMFAVEVSKKGMDFDAGTAFTWERVRHIAPSKGKETKGLVFELNWGIGNWENAIGYAYERDQYSDRQQWDENKTSQGLKIALERDDDAVDITGAVSFEDEYRPDAVGGEIEQGRVEEVMAGVRALIADVQGLGLASKVEVSFLKALSEEGALGALLAGNRKQAVKSLSDFIDKVADEIWSGQVGSVVGQALIARARALLPRERAIQVNVPISVEWPFGDGECYIDLEWERKTYPADSALDCTVTTGEVGYTREGEDFVVKTCSEQVERIYPQAKEKDKRVEEHTVEFRSVARSMDVELYWSWQSIIYPVSSLKDERSRQAVFSIGGNVLGGEIALKCDETITTYPNKPEQPVDRDVDVTLEVENEIGGNSLRVEIGCVAKHTRLASSGETPVQTGHYWELSLELEPLDGLELTPRMKWAHTEDFQDPTKDKTTFELTCGCTMRF